MCMMNFSDSIESKRNTNGFQRLHWSNNYGKCSQIKLTGGDPKIIWSTLQRNCSQVKFIDFVEVKLIGVLK